MRQSSKEILEEARKKNRVMSNPKICWKCTKNYITRRSALLCEECYDKLIEEQQDE